MQPPVDSKIMKSRDKLLASAQVASGIAVVLGIVALTLWRLLG